MAFYTSYIGKLQLYEIGSLPLPRSGAAAGKTLHPFRLTVNCSVYQIQISCLYNRFNTILEAIKAVRYILMAVLQAYSIIQINYIPEISFFQDFFRAAIKQTRLEKADSNPIKAHSLSYFRYQPAS